MKHFYFTIFVTVFFVPSLFLFPRVAEARHARYRRRPAIFYSYPQLRGGSGVIDMENSRMDKAGISRIKNDNALDVLRQAHAIVSVPASGSGFYLEENPRKLPLKFHYLRPKAATYFGELSRAYYASFHGEYKVTELVRTIEYQRWLSRGHVNALRDPGRSLHVTGYAFDIGAKDMTPHERFWLAEHLADDMSRGKVWATYEYKGALDFHVVVFP